MWVFALFQHVCKIAVLGFWQFILHILSQMVLKYYAWENLSGFFKKNEVFFFPTLVKRCCLLLEFNEIRIEIRK